MSVPDDPMWAEFLPLWVDLQKAGPSFLVAGGYGLLLKQHWLKSSPQTPTIVPLARWRNANPRATKDLDIVVGLELIASESAQAAISQCLKYHGFGVTARNPRWQFEKWLSQERRMLVEFHARLPDAADPKLATDKVRVKHKPSLGESGVHGRQNAQAIGCDRHSFRFEIEGVAIKVPNPVSWCLMKLAAMHDRWRMGLAEGADPDGRRFEREQAVKHAQDVARSLALTTREERDSASDVVAIIRSAAEFARAAAICDEFFVPVTGWGTQVIADAWQPEDVDLMRSVLVGWFKEATVGTG